MDIGSHWRISRKKIFSGCCVENGCKSRRKKMSWKAVRISLHTDTERRWCFWWEQWFSDWSIQRNHQEGLLNHRRRPFPFPFLSGIWLSTFWMGPENDPDVMLMLTLQWAKVVVIQTKGERFKMYFKIGVIELADGFNFGSGKREKSTSRISEK